MSGHVVHLALLAGLAAVSVAGCEGDRAAVPVPSADDPRLSRAREMQATGRLVESIEILRELLGERPEFDEAVYRLGLAYAESGNPSMAIWPLSRAAATDAYAIEAGNALTTALLVSGNFEAAMEAADRVLAVDPSMVALRTLRARSSLEAGQPSEALADAQALLAMDAENSAALLLFARALAALDREEEAEAAFDRALQRFESLGAVEQGAVCVVRAEFLAEDREDPERARSAYAACVAKSPSNMNVVRQAAAFYDESGDAAAATDLWRVVLEKNPDAQPVRQVLAERLEAEGDLEAALALLREGARRSRGAVALTSLAEFYRRHGRLREALQALDEASEVSGGDPAVEFAHIDLMLQAGEIDRARTAIARVEDPAQHTLLRARLALASGEDAAALRIFDEGIALMPDNAGARMLAARTAERLGDPDRALAEYRAAFRADKEASGGALAAAKLHFALAEYDASAQLAQLHLRFDRDPQIEAYVLAARAAQRAGRGGVALALRDKLLNAYPDDPRALAAWARILREAGETSAARKFIATTGADLGAVDQQPLLREAVAALEALGEPERASALALAAVERSPDVASARELYGGVLWRAGRKQQAQRELRRTIELDPRNVDAWMALAEIAWQGDDLATAFERYRRAAEVAVDPAEALYGVAQIEMVRDNSTEAEQLLEQVLELSPLHAGAANDLAWLYADSGRELSRAVDLASRAARMLPRPATYDTLGWAYFRSGRFAQAVDALARAVELGGGPSIVYRMALAYQAAGRNPEAEAAYRQALAMGPFPEEQLARQHLAEVAG